MIYLINNVEVSKKEYIERLKRVVFIAAQDELKFATSLQSKELKYRLTQKYAKLLFNQYIEKTDFELFGVEFKIDWRDKQ